MSEIVLQRDTKSWTLGTTRLRALVSRRHLAFAAALIALGAAAWYGNYWWTAGRFIETTDDAYIGGNVTTISSRVAGFVAEISVKDNQSVRVGDVILRLDDRDLRVAADHADAVLQQRRAMLASLQAKLDLQGALIRQAAADMDAKTAQAAFAREDSNRYRTLAVSSAGSQQNAQRATATDLQAQAGVSAAEAVFQASKQQLVLIEADIAQATAAISQAEADVRSSRLNLSYAEVRSPLDGYIANRAAQIGAYVSPGSFLLTVIPAHQLWVDANFKEDQVAHMRPGQPATIEADVLPGHVYRGRVVSLAPATGAIFSVIPPQNATGNFTKIVQRVPVRIELDEHEATLGQLRPGLSTTTRVNTR